MKHVQNKKNILLILVLILSTSCKSQSNETIYLLYEPEITKNCNYSMFLDESKPKKLTYIDQKIKTLIFEMCNTFFIQKKITKKELLA